jgi:hypothetical protein
VKNTYRLGKSYIDKGSRQNSQDEFLAWINIDGSGMLNSPGIRPLKFVSELSKSGLPSYLILVTTDKTGGPHNPWEDVIDYSSAEILYWGDAKNHPSKSIDDFDGNKVLRLIYDHILDGATDLVPPILHFSKPEKGVVRFNGLCALNRLEISWFDDHGSPVRNYHASLTILDCDQVSIDWLHHRAQADLPDLLDTHPCCPSAWKAYKKGRIKPIDIWQRKIRSPEEQLPDRNSPDQKILDQLLELQPFDFEKIVVAIFESLTDVTHRVTKTGNVSDGGFDFFGQFRLPRPLAYEIPFRGEVKRFKRTNGVDPKSVSRLVARLNRQEYGIFVTTSYFSKRAQREVLDDMYPVHLISGSDLILILKSLRLISQGEISKSWLEAILSSEAG